MKNHNSDFDTFKVVSESSSFQSILKWSFFFVELWGEKMANKLWIFGKIKQQRTSEYHYFRIFQILLNQLQLK